MSGVEMNNVDKEITTLYASSPLEDAYVVDYDGHRKFYYSRDEIVRYRKVLRMAEKWYLAVKDVLGEDAEQEAEK